MKDIQLYFIPTSFYSQKARLCLEEKGIRYKETLVLLTENEQNQSWYLKINPNGEVPTLKVGDEYLIESEKIMDVVDKLPSDKQRKLVPDLDSSEGKLVEFWRKKLDEIKVPIVTFGVFVFPEFSTGGVGGGMMPGATGVRDRFERTIAEAEKMKIKHPELKESYERKIFLTKQRLADFFNREKIVEVLDSTEVTVSEIEQQLSKMATSGAVSGVDYFLCGKKFTAADINLCVLLGRFRMVGLQSRFMDPQKYPHLNRYWAEVQKRSTVQKVVINNVAETKRRVIGRKIRRFTGVAAAVGVVGVAVWLGYRYLKK